MHSGLTYTHHIVPRGWGGPDCDDNLVVLTIKEHIIAHHLLARTHDPLMAYAFHMLVNYHVAEATVASYSECSNEYSHYAEQLSFSSTRKFRRSPSYYMQIC